MAFAKRFLFIAIFLSVCLQGCGLFHDEAENSDSSSSVYEPSSSSYDPADTLRVEWDYSDTLRSKDTLQLSALDSLQDQGKWQYFIGYLPQGTRLELSVFPQALDDKTRFRIRNELGKTEDPTEKNPDSAYAEYQTALDSTWNTNHFCLRDSAYYYLEVTGTYRPDVADLPDFKAFLLIDSAFYSITQSMDSVKLPSKGQIQGFFRLDDGEDSVLFILSAEAGQSITLTNEGQNIESVVLRHENGDMIDSSEARYRRLLLPDSAGTWTVKLKTVIPAYYHGPYAFFDFGVSHVDLGAGEYFALPDTANPPGDTLLIEREGSETSGWDVRHDHYLALGKLQKGDSLLIWYGMQGIANVEKSLYLVDADNQPVDTLSPPLTLNWKVGSPASVSIPAEGQYYLHYRGLGNDLTYWMDPNWTQTLKILIQKPGMLDSWKLTPEAIHLQVGDTLFLKDLSVQVSPQTGNKNFKALVNRSQRTQLKDSVDKAQEDMGLHPTGDLVQGRWLKAETSGEAVLIYQSVADPDKSDTCVVTIEP